MKILKYVIIAIVVIAGLFLANGYMNPKVEYECSVEVNKSAKESWAVMTDMEKMPQWIEGYIKTEHVSGTPNTAGAVSNVYVMDRGEEMVMKETINSFENFKNIDMTFKMDFMKMDYKMEFDEKNGITTITSYSNTVGEGIIAKSMLALMPKAMKEQEIKNLNSLKKLIEENTDDYFN